MRSDINNWRTERRGTLAGTSSGGDVNKEGRLFGYRSNPSTLKVLVRYSTSVPAGNIEGAKAAAKAEAESTSKNHHVQP